MLRIWIFFNGASNGQENSNKIKRYKLPVIKQVSHGDEKYSTRNIVNNTVQTLYGDGWSLH